MKGRILRRRRWDADSTPELHGSMAKVAPLLDIELIKLDRASVLRGGRDRRAQPGTGRHPQRAHVRPPPSRTDGELMMNICSDLPGGRSQSVRSGWTITPTTGSASTQTLSNDGLSYERG